MSWKIRSSLLPLILTMLISLGWAIPLRYTALDLGTLGGSATPLGLNDLGEVVGYFYISGNVSHAFLYSGGIMKDLGTLGGSSSQASGINNLGQVVGHADSISVQTNAFLYSNGVMTNLGLDGNGYAINNAGLIVGTGINADSYAFQSSAGAVTNLGTFGAATSSAIGVNSSGQVAGSVSYSNGFSRFRAYIYSNGVATILGTLGGLSSNARGLNDLGQVVGSSDTANGGQHAFIYSGGKMYDIGAIGGPNGFSYAGAINNWGQVVGYDFGEFNGTVEYRAFLYDQGDMLDLNSLVTLNTTLGIAYGINSSGQIIARGNNGHAYLLTPDPAVPDSDCKQVKQCVSVRTQ